MPHKKPQTDQEKIRILSRELELIFYTALDDKLDMAQRVTICSAEAALAMLRIGKPELYKVLNQQLELPLIAPAPAPALENIP